MREERGRKALGRGAVRYQNGPRQAECQVRYGGDGMRRDGRGLDGWSDDPGRMMRRIRNREGQNGAAKSAIGPAVRIPARNGLRNDPLCESNQVSIRRSSPE